MELVQLGHLFLLEVLDLLFCLSELLVDRALLALHSLLLVLQVANVELDALLLVIKVQSGVSKPLNLVNLRILAKLRVKVVIVVVIVFLLDLLFLGLLAVFVAFTVVLLDLLRPSSLLCDLFVEGQDLLVVLVISVHQVMELGEELGLFFLDVFDLLSLTDELARDFLDLLDDEALRFSALLEFVREALVLWLHRFEQDKLLKQEDQLQLSALQVTLKTVLFLLHLFDLLIEVLNIGVHLVHELSLLVFELNHADLLHFFVELSHLLLSALTIN